MGTLGIESTARPANDMTSDPGRVDGNPTADEAFTYPNDGFMQGILSAIAELGIMI